MIETAEKVVMVSGIGLKLNLGCGKNILEGWVNVDARPGPGVDVVLDIDTPNPLDTTKPWPWALREGSRLDGVEEFLLSHVLEHCRNPLYVLARCWECAAPDAVCTVRVPYGSSDDADEDPTHVRRFFVGSWGYFGQPHYWRADYGYRGDWRCERVELRVSRALYSHLPENSPHLGQIILADVRRTRNAVVEMIATLRAVKPRREPLKELQTPPLIEVVLI